MRSFGEKITAALRRFMQGRYGSDKLNTAILVVGLGACILQMFLPWAGAKLLLTLVSYGFMFWAIFRIKDRDHRYFECPRCHQTVRVPKGKGKISISCPKCKEKFIKKT